MATTRLHESECRLIPGKLKVSELFFTVPRDYSAPHRGSLQLFGRSVSRHEKSFAAVAEDEVKKKSQKPWFVYLQGGPGYGCLSPQLNSITDTILDKGYQMLYLDQRGTGLSTPVSAQTLALEGDIDQQVDFLKLFRADNIVRDCESIRRTLTEGYPEYLKKWSIFGQSFGGFCVLTYLSKYPDGLREAFTTGGLPPIGQSAEQVYQATFRKVIERNKQYYKKYPEDVDAIYGLAIHIKSQGGLQLPSGANLTIRLFLTLGRMFGFHGGLDAVHDLILRMKTDLVQFKFVTRATLSNLESALTLENSIIYAILHEAIYCENEASKWAAERVGKSLQEYKWLSELPQLVSGDAPLYFSGEMIYPFMFENFPELKKLQQVAGKLATFSDWPALYDQFQLSQNTVPLYAATFVNDMYVDFGLAQHTASLVNNCKQYITNSMYHDAIRSKTGSILKELFTLRDDPID